MKVTFKPREKKAKGLAIKQLREEMRYGQTEFAILTDIRHGQMINGYEKGTRPISFETFEKIMETMNHEVFIVVRPRSKDRLTVHPQK